MEFLIFNVWNTISINSMDQDQEISSIDEGIIEAA